EECCEHAKRALRVEPLGEGTREALRHVLRQDDSVATSAGEPREELAQRRRAAGAAADTDEPPRGLARLAHRRRALLRWWRQDARTNVDRSLVAEAENLLG